MQNQKKIEALMLSAKVVLSQLIVAEACKSLGRRLELVKVASEKNRGTLQRQATWAFPW